MHQVSDEKRFTHKVELIQFIRLESQVRLIVRESYPLLLLPTLYEVLFIIELGSIPRRS